MLFERSRAYPKELLASRYDETDQGGNSKRGTIAKSLKQIRDNDLHRAFSDFGVAKPTVKMTNALHSVLAAYAWLDPGFPFTQGMHVLAAFLTLVSFDGAENGGGAGKEGGGW